MASKLLQLVLVMVFMGCSSSLALTTSQLKLTTSTISAAPAFLPNSPVSSPPTLSPDITPLFPSPGGAAPSPTESSLPTIPSSPSPPNPDELLAPGPSMANSPSGPSPAPSSVALDLSAYLNSAMFLGLMAFWLMQLSGM